MREKWSKNDVEVAVHPTTVHHLPPHSHLPPPTTAQHSTAQHSTAQHSTAQHSTAQHSTAQHSTSQCATMMSHNDVEVAARPRPRGWHERARSGMMRCSSGRRTGRRWSRRPPPSRWRSVESNRGRGSARCRHRTAPCSRTPSCRSRPHLKFLYIE